MSSAASRTSRPPPDPGTNAKAEGVRDVLPHDMRRGQDGPAAPPEARLPGASNSVRVDRSVRLLRFSQAQGAARLIYASHHQKVTVCVC